jgi:hypothetical protein
MFKPTKQAILEQKAYRICQTEVYLDRLQHYIAAYSKRPPFSVPDRNMVKALRMLPWRNSADDWARLHVCEVFIRRRK